MQGFIISKAMRINEEPGRSLTAAAAVTAYYFMMHNGGFALLKKYNDCG
jgi:hypothetical protein